MLIPRLWRPGRISAALTAFTAAGFLVHAILQDNGGTPNSQSEWRAAVKAGEAYVPSPRTENDGGSGEEAWIDSLSTGSIATQSVAEENQESTASKGDDAVSVVSIIRQTMDVAPAVGSGTDRVSVIVAPGDTLYSISRRHGIAVGDLARLNGLSAPYTIKVGQTIYVAR